MILVSSCLAGLEVRYNGSHSLDSRVRDLIKNGKAIAVCPELMGGFSTPREPAEIVGGTGEDVLRGTAKVIEKSGRDVTELYLKGAYETLEKAKEVNASIVVLKEYSPSCGSTMIYNGEFQHKKMAGTGVTAALLLKNQVKVVSEEKLHSILAEVE
ncbi:DUF523 domain-containing protein [Bacillus badius]|uniref:DUF523 domain-containing protein n=1 Tax=Bacillus badius TaxID=1455 RepID=UPI0007B09438|nr:DUF523 domain-containing protein [Bacillus badius]KZN99885.1 hypothetical protein A4244_02990 [Bacillus badius]MED0666076.1 DUF523 domain-containing protein [Bacillus badius]OCS86056.1 hypothetical protein A6M11_02990 [Bacillus badius]OVE52481.1 hypothetical protein B1A98_08890 [Bacillus badius]TDW04235.1 uncharacterized protein YbbK (DUF523 family) [Bacillus badius]